MPQYAVGLEDGTVIIVDMVPKAIEVNGKVRVITFCERTASNGYKVTYYDEAAERPVTKTFEEGDSAVKFHTIEDVLRKTGRSYVSYTPITDPETLKDRTFRNAWKLKDRKLEVDMDKAKNIHRDRVREARNNRFAEADVDYFKALEASVKTGLSPETPEYAALEEAAAKKQKLRDAPAATAIDDAKTPEELRNAWPEELGPNPWKSGV